MTFASSTFVECDVIEFCTEPERYGLFEVRLPYDFGASAVGECCNGEFGKCKVVGILHGTGFSLGEGFSPKDVGFGDCFLFTVFERFVMFDFGLNEMCHDLRIFF